MELEWRAHFSKIGWTNSRSGFELFHFAEKLEALEINCKEMDIKVRGYYNSESDYVEGGSGELVGSVGKGRTLSAVSIQSLQLQQFIFYRCYFEHSGWSNFYKNGDICGFFNDTKESICGIQIFVAAENEEAACKKADEQLTYYDDINKLLFINDKEKMLMHLTHSYQDKRKACIRVYEESVILPLRIVKNEQVRNAVYEGGVIDSTGRFVVGHDRKNGKQINLSCLSGYEFKDCSEINETVIYGGICFEVFGHLLTESMCRLWCAFENDYKIVMLLPPNIKHINMDIFELMGIKERILFLEEPTRFHKVIVPDQTLRLHYDFKEEHKIPYSKMIHAAPKMNYEKIYLTRSHLENTDGINEEYFEKFFRKRGYVIIAPEEYTLGEQIGIINAAKDVICTLGTLSHFALFCQEGASFTIIRRDDRTVLLPQTLINQLSNVKVYFVDATYNFLPTQHTGGVFLYGPTKHFKEYLDARNIKYDEEEVAFDLERYAFQYLCKWRKNYLQIKNFNAISGCDIVDILNAMNRAFGEAEISRKKYVSKYKR
ncbi:MAG: glycosyltransferase family 61 protein [Lachnospiraceae bacterium]|nr:glycosyltransferase family 61 protein [Lachnospiraceae bacterium]